MNTKSKVIILLTLISLNVFAQTKEIEGITENDLKAHLEFIASDYMQGRDFGTEIPGLEITADYLKAQCAKMGLKDGGENYMQEMELIAIRPDADNTFIKLEDKDGKTCYENKEIFTFSSDAQNDTITSNIVFAGYGWEDETTGYNDLDGVNLKGKTVLIMTRNREAVIDSTIDKNDTNLEMVKMGRIFKAGAKALLLVPDPLNPDKSWFEMVRGYVSGGTLMLKGDKGRSAGPGKLLFGSGTLANEILKESGKTLLELQEEINRTGSPNSFELKECTANIQLGKKSAKAVGQNVIGIVEGSDPVLKNECVLFTAHYDHVGMTPSGKINNGADDNGTGTVALLEIAEAFVKMKKKPKRTIIFAWVTAEEKGLIGSAYYSRNPVIPLENTLVNINLDMVGRSAEKEPEKGVATDKSLAGPNGIYIVSGKQSSELMKISDEICKDLNLKPSGDLTKAFLTRSDYYHFYKNGIPILGLSTGLHEDYHTPGDVLTKIDYNKMKRVAQYCFLVANEVANKKKRIIVDNPVSK